MIKCYGKKIFLLIISRLGIWVWWPWLSSKFWNELYMYSTYGQHVPAIRNYMPSLTVSNLKSMNIFRSCRRHFSAAASGRIFNFVQAKQSLTGMTWPQQTGILNRLQYAWPNPRNNKVHHRTGRWLSWLAKHWVEIMKEGYLKETPPCLGVHLKICDEPNNSNLIIWMILFYKDA